MEDLGSATFFFVYSFDPPNAPPEPNTGQEGTRAAFVDGALASTTAFAWQTGELANTAIGECAYSFLPLTMTYGQEDDIISEEYLWLPTLGIRLLVSTDDGFVTQSNPPIQISAR